MRTPFHCIALLALAIAGCESASEEDVDSAEQHGTAAQDAEVALLRRRFANAAQALPGGGQDVQAFEPVARRDGVKRTWTCAERDAKKNSPPKATPVTYAFTVDAAQVKMDNSGTGFGKLFVLTTSGFTGYPAGGNMAGELVTRDFIRSEGGFGAHSAIYIERVTSPAVEKLSAAEQNKFDAMGNDYEQSVTPVGGHAIAYVECTTYKDN